MSFKIFSNVNLKEVTSSSGINIFWILYALSCILSDVDHIILMVNTITINMVLDLTYEFINGMTIPYLKHCAYFHMDVDSAKPMQYLRSCKLRVIFHQIRLLGNISPYLIIKLYSFYSLFSKLN